MDERTDMSRFWSCFPTKKNPDYLYHLANVKTLYRMPAGRIYIFYSLHIAYYIFCIWFDRYHARHFILCIIFHACNSYHFIICFLQFLCILFIYIYKYIYIPLSPHSSYDNLNISNYASYQMHLILYPHICMFWTVKISLYALCTILTILLF